MSSENETNIIVITKAIGINIFRTALIRLFDASRPSFSNRLVCIESSEIEIDEKKTVHNATITSDAIKNASVSAVATQTAAIIYFLASPKTLIKITATVNCNVEPIMPFFFDIFL